MKAGQLVRIVVGIAAGILLGIGTDSHPPGFAHVFAHAWGVATLIMIALALLLVANRAVEWAGDKRQDRQLAKRSR